MIQAYLPTPYVEIVFQILMVEETNTLLDEGNTQLLCCRDDGLVVLAAARGRDVLHAAAACPEYLILLGTGCQKRA
jgi:hypothetical protein